MSNSHIRTISDIRAREIIDSRGNPTVEVEVMIDDGSLGRTAVPSGASTGAREAKEIRDEDPDRFRGKGVMDAVSNVNGKIRDMILGIDPTKQREIDLTLSEADGTDYKSSLGANAILATSMACAKAAANSVNLPLYRYLGGMTANLLPVPFMNILNGGEHADNNVDVQEFMIVPHGASSFAEAFQWGCEVYHALKAELARLNLAGGVGDEGGYAPDLDSDEKALDLLVNAVERAGYEPGRQISLALDVAASEVFTEEGYKLCGETMSAGEVSELYQYWCDQYPIISIEDGMAEDDWKGWKVLTDKLSHRVQLIGDDLFVTDVRLLERGVENDVANSILIKPNQIGTVTETLDAVHLAGKYNYGVCVSHRSGETADTFIADLAVAVRCGQIKSGAPCRMDRVEKYNQLLRIEEDLGRDAQFARSSVFMLK